MRFDAYVSDCNELDSTMEADRTSLDELKHSIYQRALPGILMVNGRLDENFLQRLTARGNKCDEGE